MHCLTDRFHLAVRVFPDIAWMTPECGNNKEVHITGVLTTF